MGLQKDFVINPFCIRNLILLIRVVYSHNRDGRDDEEVFHLMSSVKNNLLYNDDSSNYSFKVSDFIKVKFVMYITSKL